MEFVFRIKGHCALEVDARISAKSIEEAEQKIDAPRTLLYAQPTMWPQVDSVELISVEGSKDVQ